MSNHQFTVRIKPYEGESLSGFIFRLLRLNGIPILSFLNKIKMTGTHYLQRSDLVLLDSIPANIISIDRISEMTGCSVDEILSTTFHNILKAFCVSDDFEHARFMSGIVVNNYRFCPECLREKSYHRLLWKINDILVCPIHKTLLLDICWSCKKTIKLSQLIDLNRCPHCGSRLSNSSNVKIEFDLDQQLWMYQAWELLIQSTSVHITPPEVSARLLYLIGDRSPTFDRKIVESTIHKRSILPTLLQHARNSLSQKRTLHVSVILSILYEQGISLHEFENVDVPQSFMDSLKQSTVRKVDQLSCQAPWCSGYGLPGTLIKTGTTLKRRKSGEILLYYLVCTECGCEYAVDASSSQLKERTYFIEAYRLLSRSTIPSVNLKQLAQATRMTVDKLRRCLAYFCTRQVFMFGLQAFNLDQKLIQQFVSAIKSGIKLKEIQRWSCWNNYDHFLVYRFHQQVLQALLELKRHHKERRVDSAVNRERVRNVVRSLVEYDEDITIRAVCKLLGVCPETIRSWGCNDFIAKEKQLQWEQRIQKSKDEMYQKVEDYLSQNLTNVVTAKGMYNLLRTNRTVLWRIAPEITAYIHERLVQHNQGVKGKII